MRFTYVLGIRFGDWIRLLAECRFNITLKCLPRAGVITGMSLINSLLGGLENLRHGRTIDEVEIKAHPLFVLGHQRSGTTHLHNLLMLDPEFAAPTLSQVFLPHSFLFFERVLSNVIDPRLRRTRGFDNIRLELESPQEEELALCALGAPSTYLSLLLPQRINEYMKCLDPREMPEDDVRRWERIYVRYLKKLTFRYGRRLALKSPPNTARIRTLLKLFPDAQFVHISRHPYDVFQSYRYFLIYLYQNFAYLQEPKMYDLDAHIFRHYTEMYDAFFGDLFLLAENRFHALRFEDLEKSPLSEMKSLYEKLELAEFGRVEPKIESYMRRIRGYQKNTYSELSNEEKRKIRQAWSRSFEAWNYDG